MALDQSRTALVTGASSGIGEAVVRELVKSGYRVICAARRIERLNGLAADFGPSALPVALDLRDSSSIRTLKERLPLEWRIVDVLVNNAGHDVGGRKRFDEGSIEDWAATIETNTIGTMRITYEFAGEMVARGRGHIVNIGSIFGLIAPAGSAAYASSKFAINGFSKSILDDYRGKGVRVTQVLPGVTRTEFSETRWHGDKEKVEDFYGRFAEVLRPEDVGRAVRFAVDQPPHVTISDIVIVPSA